MRGIESRKAVLPAVAASGVVALAAAGAGAQPYVIDRYTIDGGGGTSSGGAFSVTGTIGQHDAGRSLAGPQFELAGGFWASRPDRCRADFDGDGDVNTQDVLAFLNAWAAQDPRADFNGDGQINTQDVLAFLNAWTAGC